MSSYAYKATDELQTIDYLFHPRDSPFRATSFMEQ